MDQNDLMAFVIGKLESQQIRYVITGSHASNVYGETRFTNDIDLVVDLDSQDRLNKLLLDFPQGLFYVSDAGARHAVDHGGQFNIIHEDTSQKVDFIVTVDPRWPDLFIRRKQIKLPDGSSAWVISPEDLILRKMDFYREGGSDKHLRDIAAMLQISGDRVDRTYITEWSANLKLSDIWQEIIRRISP